MRVKNPQEGKNDQGTILHCTRRIYQWRKRKGKPVTLTLAPLPMDTKCLEQASLVYKDNTKAFWFSKNYFLRIQRRENNTNGGLLTIWWGISSTPTLVKSLIPFFSLLPFIASILQTHQQNLTFLNPSIYHSSGVLKQTADAEPNWTNGKSTGHKPEAEELQDIIPGLETGCISSCSIT